ncbi:MAG: hypothetical protein IJQ85_08095 [Selenomonadaceae bacterium]|nr:hypothetical protein [Selenomonadaceae bacterium]
MEIYKKPAVISRNFFNGVVPSAIMPLVGLSLKGLAVVGAGLGLATGMASSKGVNDIDSTHNITLTERKNFALG